MKLGTILNKTIRYCNYREHSVTEVEKFIDKFDITNKDKLFIIDYLIKEKFIDNKRYTREYIISKFKINKWGRSRIIVNLKKQNIDSSDIDKELALIDSSEYAETLKNILLKKKGALNNASKIEVRAKLLRYALYKGFEVDLINKELNEIIK